LLIKTSHYRFCGHTCQLWGVRNPGGIFNPKHRVDPARPVEFIESIDVNNRPKRENSCIRRALTHIAAI